MPRRKKKTHWQIKMLYGFMDGILVGVDPLGVLIQTIGSIRQKDWRAIGGYGLVARNSLHHWLGKVLSIVGIVCLGWMAFADYWQWLLGIQGTLFLCNLFGIWWRKGHEEPDPEPEVTEEPEIKPSPDPEQVVPVTSGRPEK